MTGLIVLAAGASNRLGKPKQLLPYKGQSLLDHAVQAGLDAGCQPVVVVLGAYFDEIRPRISRQEILIARNTRWEEGIGSSIGAGVRAMLKENPDLDRAIVMLCDQPFVGASLLGKLIRTNKTTGKGIVASAYEDTIGVPVLYDKSYFPDLLDLNGDTGAKRLLFKHRRDVATVPFPAGSVDIDTADDYEALQ